MTKCNGTDLRLSTGVHDRVKTISSSACQKLILGWQVSAVNQFNMTLIRMSQEAVTKINYRSVDFNGRHNTPTIYHQ